MNLQHLEYFISVAHTENFSASARMLSVSQPALSKSISGLEETLGVPLFEKYGRNVRLTEYGRIFATYAAAAINELNAGKTELTNTLMKNSRRLSFAVPTGINIFWENNLVNDFSKQQPDMNVGIYRMDYDDMLLAIKRDLVDYGICFEENVAVGDADLNKIHVGYYCMGALVSSKSELAQKDYVSFKELADKVMITPEDGAKEHFRKFIMNHTGNSEQLFDACDWSDLFNKVENDEGVYVCARNGNAWVSSLRSKLLLISDASACRNMYLICNKYKKVSPAMESFKSYIKAAYRSKE